MTTSNKLLQAASTSQKSLQSNIPEYVSEFNLSSGAKGLSIQLDGSGTFHVYTIISGDIYHYTFSATEDISNAVLQDVSTAIFGSIMDLEVKSDGTKGVALISNGNVTEFSFGTDYDASTITIDATYTTEMNNGLDYWYINKGATALVWYIGVDDGTDSVQRWALSTTDWDFSGTWTKEAEWYSFENSSFQNLAAESLRGRTVNGDGVGIGVSAFGTINRYYESPGDGDTLDNSNDEINLFSLRPLIGSDVASAYNFSYGSYWFSSAQANVSRSTLFILTEKRIGASSYQKIIAQFSLQGDEAYWGFPTGDRLPTLKDLTITLSADYMHLSQDGRYAMFVGNSSVNWYVSVYEFGTKGDISTLTYYDDNSTSRSGSTTTYFNIYASPDGKKVFQGTAAGEVRMIEYTGGNDWEPSSATGTTQTSFSDVGRIVNATDITFSKDGLKMFIVNCPSGFASFIGGTTSTLLEYSVSSPFSFTGATFVGSIDIDLGGNVMTANFSNNGRQLYLFSDTASSAIQIDLDAPYQLPASNLYLTDMNRKVQYFGNGPFGDIQSLGGQSFYLYCYKIYEDVYGQRTLSFKGAGLDDVYSVPKV